MAERNAARGLPDAGGAANSARRPSRISGQPSSWGAVGSPRRSLNQVRTAGWKGSSAVTTSHSTGKDASPGTFGSGAAILFAGGRAMRKRYALAVLAAILGALGLR